MNHIIEPTELQNQLERGTRYQLIDVRSATEFEEGHVPGAINIPMEQVESRLDDLTKRDPVVMICQSGRRAGITCEMLSENHDNVVLLNGGTMAWKASGLPVVESVSRRLPLQRQVFLIAGPLVLLGAVLGYFLNPAWLTLSAFVGTGLTVAGATGFCGMAILLAAMPWNKVKPNKTSSTKATQKI